MAGIRAASGDAVLFTDMDQATPITYAADLLARIDAGADVAIGSRGLRRPGAPPGRVLLSIGQMALRSILVGLHLTDTQCGFKAFARPVALDVLDGLRVYHPDRLTGPAGPSVSSGFDVEFLYVAQRMGYRIDEVPVTWSYADTRRVRLGLDAARGVRDLVRIAGAGLRGAYAERTAAVPNRA
jgi:dolichyl-phosphate beta-glucosyltransferase